MKVHKTIKLYIGGKFPRTESGRSFSQLDAKGNECARLCQASRKDLREAVVAAKTGWGSWSKLTPFNRSQILYRMAEMTEGKRGEFSELFQTILGITSADANKMIDEGIDAFIYYAGFCDKVGQVAGSVNPINGPFHNFSTPDSMGVIMHIDNEEFSFGKLVEGIAAALVGGNSVITLLGPKCPAVLAPLAEVFATSDVPAGAVNLLSGDLNEIFEFIGGHREIRGVSYQHKSSEQLKTIQTLGAENMKRIIKPYKKFLCLENILSCVEFKTVWHPIGY